MARSFHLTIAKLGANLFEGEALSATFPGVDGVFEVLAGHEAFVTPLRAGNARIVDAAGTPHTFPVHEGGIAEVSENQATILL